MSRRSNASIRCARCRMHHPLCICEHIPQLLSRTRLELLIHYREARKPTNTGLLAASCLPSARISVVGTENQAAPAFVFAADEAPVLLFPADNALDLAAFAQNLCPAQRPVLIVPDGNWRQAAKFRARIQGLAEIPCAILPKGAPTTYQLRGEPVTGGLATLEAIARALEILEAEPAISKEMLKLFRYMVDRTLWLRGELPAAQVFGGISPEAIEFYEAKSRDAVPSEPVADSPS